MTIIADRGLFVRLLTASGKVGQSEAEAYADALDGASRDPATKADITELRASTTADIAELRASTTAEFAELRSEIALLAQRMESQAKRSDERLDELGRRLIERMDAQEKRADARIEAAGNQQLLRFLAISVAVASALFAALRYTAA